MRISNAVDPSERAGVVAIGVRYIDLRKLQTRPLPGVVDKGDEIPANAMLHEDGQPMLFEDGAFMLYEG